MNLRAIAGIVTTGYPWNVASLVGLACFLSCSASCSAAFWARGRAFSVFQASATCERTSSSDGTRGAASLTLRARYRVPSRSDELTDSYRPVLGSKNSSVNFLPSPIRDSPTSAPEIWP